MKKTVQGGLLYRNIFAPKMRTKISPTNISIHFYLVVWLENPILFWLLMLHIWQICRCRDRNLFLQTNKIPHCSRKLALSIHDRRGSSSKLPSYRQANDAMNKFPIKSSLVCGTSVRDPTIILTVIECDGVISRLIWLFRIETSLNDEYWSRGSRYWLFSMNG